MKTFYYRTFAGFGSRKHPAGVIIILLCFLFSCNPDPSVETLMSYSVRFDNISQERFFPGEKVNVVVHALNNLNPDDPVRIEFSIINGGGTISASSAITQDGKATIEWTMGNDSFKSTLRASIFSSSGEYLSYADLTANCFIPDSWNEVTTDPDARMTDLIADTVNKFTLMVTNGSVYRQGSRYYIWEKFTDPLLESCRTIEIDNQGIIYVSTWEGNIIRSTDHGISWSKCNKPYPDNPYYIYMSVANDNSIWAGKFENPTKFSRDGGITWQSAGSKLSSFLNVNVFRLKSGAIVSHGTNEPNKYRLNVSYDEGLTWTTSETPGYSTTMYVNEKDEIFIGTQENGYTIYKTTDLGATYVRVISVYPSFGTTMENNIFKKWGNFYYIIVPGLGVLKSADLEHYEKFWSFPDIIDLFIDHKGVLISKGRDWRSVYYLSGE